MKVSFTPQGTIGAYVTLFDETNVASGAVLEAFDPVHHLQPQKTPLANSADPFLSPRSSAGIGFTLAFWLAYDTRAEALESVRDSEIVQLGKKKFHLKVEEPPEEQYYPNAVVDEYRAHLVGLSVLHTLQITSQDVTDEDPSQP